MYFGCDYYPEHWPEQRWEKDARMMAKAGFNTVRLAEFAWIKIEPREGRFDFSWLDKAVGVLAEHEIRVVLGTPTAAPPAWLVTKRPTILRVNQQGIRTSFGGRRNYCPNSPKYRTYSKNIVSRMAEHYGSNECVIGWQIDNEFGGDGTKGMCYCDNCATQFRRWLKEKYANLERLNHEWGTIFWSQTYTAWGQICPPRQLETAHNPSLLLDYRRFISDSYIDYQQMQIDMIRESSKHQFITHNFMGLFNGLDYYKLAEPLDFAVWDNYPKHLSGKLKTPVSVSFAHDLTRGLKSKNFWIMEQQSGPAGWPQIDPNYTPEELRLWTYQSFAHGAEGVLYFRWRTSRFGTEQFWHGILDHSGITGRRYEEIKRTGKELMHIGDQIANMRFPQEIAMITSYDEQWAFDIQPVNSQFDYQDHLISYYELLRACGVSIDVISAHEKDLSAYKLIIAPNLFLLNEDIADNLKKYVKRGGILVVTFLSGIKSWNGVVFDEPLPAKLTDLTGIELTEYDSLSPKQHREMELIHLEFPRAKGECTIWCDLIKCKQADVVGRYNNSYYQGEPCVTLNRFGKGYCMYIGTNPSPLIKKCLLKGVLNKAGIEMLSERDPQKLELVRNKCAGVNHLFLLNHSEKTESLELRRDYLELLHNRKYKAKSIIEVEPKGIRILREA